MIGAIIGDVLGSYYEAFPTKQEDFRLLHPDARFTDDTVLSVAVAEWVMTDGNLVDLFHEYFDRYPQAGYGESFVRWAGYRKQEPYNSWGNGSAMRVSPIAYACQSDDEVLERARESAIVTHDHPQGVQGAQAVALGVFLARKGLSKQEIRCELETRFPYDLSRSLAEIRPTYHFDVSCQGSVPESLIAFFESTCFESAIRNAISLGGDADTMACISGGLAEAFYGEIPETLQQFAWQRLDEPLRRTLEKFAHTYTQ